MSAEDYSNHILKVAVAQICQAIGWHSIQSTPLELMTDILSKYLQQIARKSNRYAELYNRTDPNINDVALVYKDMSINISDLEEYIRNVDPVSCTIDVPQYPLSKDSHLNFLKPGSKEVVTRPVHIHEHLPPVNPIKDEEDEVELISHSQQQSKENNSDELNINGNETSLNNLDEDDKKFFKRPIDPQYYDSTNKKSRQPFESDVCRPIRELTSVIMTSTGFISPAREGKLPDSKAPITPPEIKPIRPTPPPPAIIGSIIEAKFDKKIKKRDKMNLERFGGGGGGHGVEKERKKDKANRPDKIMNKPFNPLQPVVQNPATIMLTNEQMANMSPKQIAKLKGNLNKPIKNKIKKIKPPKDGITNSKKLKLYQSKKQAAADAALYNKPWPNPEDFMFPASTSVTKISAEPDKQKLNIFKKISRPNPDSSNSSIKIEKFEKLEKPEKPEKPEKISKKKLEESIIIIDDEPAPLENYKSLWPKPYVDQQQQQQQQQQPPPQQIPINFHKNIPPLNEMISTLPVPLTKEEKKKRREKAKEKKQKLNKQWPNDEILNKMLPKPPSSKYDHKLQANFNPYLPLPPQPIIKTEMPNIPPIQQQQQQHPPNPMMPFPFFPFPSGPGLIPNNMFPQFSNLPSQFGMPPNMMGGGPPDFNFMDFTRFRKPIENVDLDEDLHNKQPEKVSIDTCILPPLLPDTYKFNENETFAEKRSISQVVVHQSSPLPPSIPLPINNKIKQIKEEIPREIPIPNKPVTEIFVNKPSSVIDLDSPVRIDDIIDNDDMDMDVIDRGDIVEHPDEIDFKDKKEEKKLKKDKRDKEGKIKKKKDKKDKSKHKEKSEKKKEKEEKRADKEVKEKIKKEKKEKRRERLDLIPTESDVDTEPSIPKLTLKLGPTVLRPDTPDSVPKITIKPFKTEEVHPPIIREASPELARISALVTRPPKPIKIESKPIEEKPIIDEPISEKISTPSLAPIMKGRPRKSQDGMDLNKSKPLNKANSTLDAAGDEVWICPACGKVDDGTSAMIGCDGGCDAWYHWVCVGIQVAPNDTDDWYCRLCIKKQQESHGSSSEKKKKRKKKDKKEH